MVYAPSPDFHYAIKNELYLICALCYCDCLREIYASLLSDTYCDRLSTDLKTIKLIRPSDMHDAQLNSHLPMSASSGDSEQSRHNCVIMGFLLQTVEVYGQPRFHRANPRAITRS